MTSISATNALRFQGSVYLSNQGQMSPDLLAAVQGSFNKKINRDTKPEIQVAFNVYPTGGSESDPSNLVQSADVFRLNPKTKEREAQRSFAWEEPSALTSWIPGRVAASRAWFLSSLLSYAKQLNDPNFPLPPDLPADDPEDEIPAGLEGAIKLPVPGSKERPLAVNRHVVKDDTGAVVLRFPTTS